MSTTPITVPVGAAKLTVHVDHEYNDLYVCHDDHELGILTVPMARDLARRLTAAADEVVDSQVRQ